MLAIVFGFILMFPLGFLFGAMNWPTFHSWGLMHGGFFSAWPTLSLVSFATLSLVPWFRPISDAPLLAIAALVGLGITSALVVADSGGQFRVPVALAGVTVACSALLCYFARRRWLVALVIALPMAFFDSQFLLMSVDSILSYLRFNFLRVTTPIIVAAFIGLGVAYVAKRAVRV